MQHKNSITGLSFRRNAPELYSCSVDKTVKVRIYNFAELNFYLNFCQVWDTDSRSYIETLFGHQDTVHGIDANTRERAITAGGRDNTIRIFKIPEETQLVYRLSISQWRTKSNGMSLRVSRIFGLIIYSKFFWIRPPRIADSIKLTLCHTRVDFIDLGALYLHSSKTTYRIEFYISRNFKYFRISDEKSKLKRDKILWKTEAFKNYYFN